MSEGTRHPLDRDSAAVDIRMEVEVAAPTDVVWEVLTRFKAWPLWHRGVSFAVLRGELAPGTRLHWRADGMRIRSELKEVEPERTLGFTLRTMGGRGYHRWTLLPLDAERTLVRSEEVWEGFVARLLRRTLRRTLEVSRANWLEALRERAEGR